MRSVNFTTLQTAATNMVSNYTYQFQPRVDGDIISDTCMFSILDTVSFIAN